MAFIVKQGSIYSHVGRACVSKLEGIDEVINETYDIRAKVALTIEVQVEGEKHTIVEKSQSTLQAKDWSRKFYIDKAGNTKYTRNQTVLALVEIFKAKKNANLLEQLKKGEGVDLELFLKKEFAVSFVWLEDTDTKFIDWYETLKLNGVKTPNLPSDNSDMVESELSEDEDKLPFD